MNHGHKDIDWLSKLHFEEDGVSVPITKVMYLLWRLRGVHEGFQIETEEGRWQYFSWFITFARQEFPSLPFSIDNQLKKYLKGPASDVEQDAVVHITCGLKAAWQARQDLQEAYDVNLREGRLGLVTWWLAYGHREHDFLEIDEQLKEYLGEPADEVPQDARKLMPRLLLMLYNSRRDLRESFDLGTSEGRAGLAEWWSSEGQREFGWYGDEHGSGVELGSDKTIEIGDGSENRMRADSSRTKTFGARNRYGVNLVGFARGELGIGEDVRMGAAALSCTDVPFCVYDGLPPSMLFSRASDKRIEKLMVERPIYATNILCMTGIDVLYYLLYSGPELFRDRNNIGAWPWELPQWPKSLEDAYRLVDEIWASSRYTADAYRESSPVPVQHMTMAVKIEEVPDLPRADFGLPDDCFLFLFAFDGLSGFYRKNPQAVVTAFVRAFHKSNKDVRLVLKSMNAGFNPTGWSMLAKLAEKDDRIILINEAFTRSQTVGLFNVCDAYVSLHRAEGFGRTIAEAMLLGKPVIVTNHSGNTDFTTVQTAFLVDGPLVRLGPMDYPFGEGQYWCEPDIDQAALHMRTCFFDKEGTAQIARAGKRFVQDNHNPEIIGKQYRKRLQALGLLQS
jgi:glycosyltransferase involved in cell wall biosynthesis